eukprot:6741047-Heterocapsa_arctica.AAC.1
MRDPEGGRLGDHTDRPRSRMPPEDMYHMFGKGQHQRLQDGGLCDQQQLYIGALGKDVSGPAIQELGHPGEDRQD